MSWPNTYKAIKSKKITQSARGEVCTLNTPVCTNNTDTTVFCHAPSEVKGMGNKSPDYWGAYGCQQCHTYLDGNNETRLDRLAYWYRGIFRTMRRLYEKGIIRIS
jgi:hypothetical protein